MSKTRGTRWCLTFFLCYIGQAVSPRPAPACNLGATPSCPNYDMVRQPLFHGFFQQQQFDLKCRAFQRAFECIYKHLETCSNPRASMAFDVQKLVVEEACVKRNTDYKSSQGCFSTPMLATRVQSCLSRKPDCRNQILSAVCAQDAVTSTDKCNVKDGLLMRSLIEAYYEPARSILKCAKPTRSPPTEAITDTTSVPSTSILTKSESTAAIASPQPTVRKEPLGHEADDHYVLPTVSAKPPHTVSPLVADDYLPTPSGKPTHATSPSIADETNSKDEKKSPTSHASHEPEGGHGSRASRNGVSMPIYFTVTSLGLLSSLFTRYCQVI